MVMDSMNFPKPAKNEEAQVESMCDEKGNIAVEAESEGLKKKGLGIVTVGSTRQ